MRRFLVILLALISCLACFRTNPKAPSWDTEITIPLLYERYSAISIGDTTDPDIQVWFDEDSIMTLYFRADIDSFYPADSFRIEDFTDWIGRSVGDMWGTGLKPETTRVGMEEIIESVIGDIEIPDTGIVIHIIPPIDYTASFQDSLVDIFDSIVVSIAYLRVIVENFTNVPFDSIIWVHNIGGLEELVFAPVLPDSFAVVDASAEQATFHNLLSAEPNFITLDTLRDVRVFPEDSVGFILHMDSVKLLYGSLKLPSLTDTVSDTFNYPFETSYDFDLDIIQFDSVDLAVIVDNRLPVGAYLSTRIDQMDTTFNMYIAPDAVSDLGANMFGITFDNSEAPSGSVHVSMRVAVLTDSSDDFVFVDAAVDSVIVEVRALNPAFNYISGELLSPISYPIPETRFEVPVDYGGVDSIIIAESDLYVDIWNAVGFAAEASVLVTGKSASGDLVTLPVGISVGPGDVGWPEHDSSVTNAVPLLNILPESIMVSGIARLPAGAGFLRKDSYVCGEVSSEAPFKVAFVPDTFYYDTTNRSIDEDIVKLIQDVSKAELVFKITNHFPFPFDCDFVVFKEAPDTNLFIKRMTFPAAPYGPDGIAIGAMDTIISLTIDSLEFEIFKDPPFKDCAILYIPETDTITIHARDYLEFGSYCVITVRVKP